MQAGRWAGRRAGGQAGRREGGHMDVHTLTDGKHGLLYSCVHACTNRKGVVVLEDGAPRGWDWGMLKRTCERSAEIKFLQVCMCAHVRLLVRVRVCTHLRMPVCAPLPLCTFIISCACIKGPFIPARSFEAVWPKQREGGSAGSRVSRSTRRLMNRSNPSSTGRSFGVCVDVRT